MLEIGSSRRLGVWLPLIRFAMSQTPQALRTAAMHFALRVGDIPKITGLRMLVEQGPIPCPDENKFSEKLVKTLIALINDQVGRARDQRVGTGLSPR